MLARSSSKYWWIVVAAPAALILLMFPGMPHIIPGVEAATNPPSQSSCAPNQWAALSAPKDSNQFGPAITDPSLQAGQNRFTDKMANCGGDALFTATIKQYVAKGIMIDPAAARSDAQRYLNDNAAWQSESKATVALIASYSVEDDSQTYETISMIPNGNDVPFLSVLPRPVPAGHVLVLHLKDGSVRRLRYSCDLQPAELHFPLVQQPPAAPPTTVKVVPTPPAPPAPPVPTTLPTPICTDTGLPVPVNGKCPKTTGEISTNPQAKPQDKGPGTTPIGASPGPATPACDTSTGSCNPPPPSSGATTTTSPPSSSVNNPQASTGTTVAPTTTTTPNTQVATQPPKQAPPPSD